MKKILEWTYLWMLLILLAVSMSGCSADDNASSRVRILL